MPCFFFSFLASYCQLCLQADAQEFGNHYIRTLVNYFNLIMKLLLAALHNYLTFLLMVPVDTIHRSCCLQGIEEQIYQNP
uniref:Secreted protein n=1 Tax=Populus trichocarpa TaxID=3694 RepID=A0A2K1XJD5_POPTR